MSAWPRRSCITLSSPTTTRPTDWAVWRRPLGVMRGTPALAISRSITSAEVARVDPAADRIGEHQAGVLPSVPQEPPLGLLPLAVRGEHGGGCRPEGDDAIGVLGLELLEHRVSTLDGELLVHGQVVGLEVDVAPAEGEQLAPAQAGDERQLEGWRQPVIAHRGEEAASLGEGPPELPSRSIPPRRLGEPDRVAAQSSALHGLLERHRQHLAHVRADVAPSRRLPLSSDATSAATQPSTTSGVRSRRRTLPISGTMWRSTAQRYWSNVEVSTRPSFERSHTCWTNSPTVSVSVPARPSSTARRWAVALAWCRMCRAG